MEYQYPLDYDWSNEEMVTMVKFYEAIEKAYEKGIIREELMGLYRRFKEIVPSKAEEKKIDKEFPRGKWILYISCYSKGKRSRRTKACKM